MRRRAVMSFSLPPVHPLKHIVVAPDKRSFVIPRSRAAVLNDSPPSRGLMKTKALFFVSGLLSCRNYAHVLGTVRKKHGGDAGMIQGSKQRRREWWWGEWIVTGAQPTGSLMTCGQLTLSQLIRLLFPAHSPAPLGFNFPLCLQPLSRRRAALPLHPSLLFSLSPSLAVPLHFFSSSFSHPIPSRAGSSRERTVFVSFFISALEQDWKNEAILISPSIVHVVACLSLGGNKSLWELVFGGNLCPCCLQWSLKTGCDPCW